MKAYKNDPFWMTARYESKCNCGATIRAGSTIFYYPRTKTALCPLCGDVASKDFEACAADEDFYNYGK